MTGTNFYLKCVVTQDNEPIDCCSQIKSVTIGIICIFLAFLGLLSIMCIGKSPDQPHNLFIVFSFLPTFGLFLYVWNERESTKDLIGQISCMTFSSCQARVAADHRQSIYLGSRLIKWLYIISVNHYSAVQCKVSNSLMQNSSVSDPFNFDMDPDPT